jgi:uncharacterized protein YfaS (alpha-2-macroglobulin family)
LSLYNDAEDIYEILYSENGNTIAHFHNLENLPKRLEFDIYAESKSPSSTSVAFEVSTDFAMDDMDGAAPSVGAENLMDKAVSVSNSEQVRSDFVDSAFFAKNIEVKNGVATFTIPKLPDNLTTWKILGYAISDNAEVAQISEQFQVKKPIAIFPNLPRFFVE